MSADMQTSGVILAELGERKTVLIRFRDRRKRAVDISSGWSFEVIVYNATERLFTLSDPDDFDMSGAVAGELRVPMTFSKQGRWKMMLIATQDRPHVVLKPTFLIEITQERIPAIR